MNTEVRYVKFDPLTKSGEILMPGLIQCYRTVFGDEPWNEWKKCLVCGSKWGLLEVDKLKSLNCKHCGETLVDFWPSSVVRNSIYEEITSEASCWLAVVSDAEVVGFCWGYPVAPAELEKKLKLPGVKDGIESNFGKIDLVAYQDEIGVIKEYRNKNIAKAMFKKRLEDFLGAGVSVGIVRTMSSPPSAAFSWYEKLGYKVISEYNDEDRRVILARSLKDLDI